MGYDFSDSERRWYISKCHHCPGKCSDNGWLAVVTRHPPECDWERKQSPKPIFLYSLKKTCSIWNTDQGGTRTCRYRGDSTFFSGRGVRPRFPKCGACELILASEKGGLWTENFQIWGLANWKFPNLGLVSRERALPKNMWRYVRPHWPPFSNRLSLNDPLFNFHICSHLMTPIFKMLSHLMTPFFRNICWWKWASCSYWMTPIFTNKWPPRDMYPIFVWN